MWEAFLLREFHGPWIVTITVTGTSPTGVAFRSPGVLALPIKCAPFPGDLEFTLALADKKMQGEAIT